MLAHGERRLACRQYDTGEQRVGLGAQRRRLQRQQRRRHLALARVVEQNVEPATPFGRAVYQGIQLFVMGDVGGDEFDAFAQFLH